MPSLDFDGTAFLFRCRSSENLLPQEAGFSFKNFMGGWYTQSPMAAAGLREYATASAERKLKETLIDYSPWLQPLPSPPPGLALKPHQPEAVYFALDRNRCYLGLDPGLGKTIVAAMVAAALDGPVVYICPPFLVRNVEEEFQRWAPDLEIGICGVGEQPEHLDVLIIPDSVISRDSIQPGIKRWIGKHPAALFIDEAHRFKNSGAQRTQALFGTPKTRVAAAQPGIVDLFERQIFMSGTPMPNRPMELFPLLTKAAPQTIDWMAEFTFGRIYCAGHRGRFGWDFTGASNVKELAKRVIHPHGPFMLRQKKALLDLPPKTEEVFVVSADMSPRLAKLDRGIGAAYASIDDLMKKRLALKHGEDELHTATYRRLLGLEKVKPAVEYITSLMEETDEALIVCAYHIEVIEQLAKRLERFKPFVISGKTPKGKRHQIVKAFQKPGAPRIILGNYLSMGIGFNLTRATRVLMTEFSWVPGDNDQLGDRAHRIGQTKPVLVQYMVWRNSIDKRVIERLIQKRNSTNHI